MTMKVDPQNEEPETKLVKLSFPAGERETNRLLRLSRRGFVVVAVKPSFVERKPGESTVIKMKKKNGPGKSRTDKP